MVIRYETSKSLTRDELDFRNALEVRDSILNGERPFLLDEAERANTIVNSYFIQGTQ